MTEQHVTAGRIWALIRDRGEFEPAESAHIQTCGRCHEAATRFAEQARRAGFPITFTVPPLEFEQRKGA
jgi:hypothetical protein